MARRTESYARILELVESPNIKEWRERRMADQLSGDIELDHFISICPHMDERVISDFSLVISLGEHVAFVGSSGAGKSTLTNPSSGSTHPSPDGSSPTGLP